MTDFVSTTRSQVARRKKKAKNSHASAPPRPLGSAAEPQEGKDDEERELESFLFGVPFTVSRNGKGKALLQDDDLLVEPNRASELNHVADAEVSTLAARHS